MKIIDKKKILVGYLLSEQKQKNLNFVENIKRADIDNEIELVKIESNLHLSIDNFQDIDLIIHRVISKKNIKDLDS